jgi:hypothetical protein
MTYITTKPRTLSLQLGLLLLTAATSALAQTYTQVQTFPFNFSNSGDSPLVIANNGDFSGQAQPFNPLLGPLVSFEIAWNITMTGAGIAGDPSGTIGSSGASAGYYFAGVGYSGNGNGNGDSGPLDEPLSFSFNIVSSHLFLVSNAGVTYDPAMLDAVVGGSSFPILWDTGYSVSANNAHSLSGTAIGSLKLTYTYLPEASTNFAMGLAFAAVGGVVWRRRKAVTSEVAQATTK